MKFKFRMLTVLTISTVMSASSVQAYKGIEADFASCTQGQGKISNDKIFQACSRLINNAKKENETIGFFYAFRALAGSDKNLKCQDARKVLQLVKNANMVKAARSLEKSNC